MSRSARVMAVVAGGVFAASAWAGPGSSGVSHPGHGVRARPVVVLPGGGATDGQGGFSENFDTYANGSILVPQGGWLYWNGSGPPVSNIATVDNSLSASPPNSLTSILETDNVKVLNISSGHWICKAKTYTPSTATGLGYFIVLNQYAYPNPTNVGNWTIEVHFDRATNLVTSVNRTVANGGPGNTTLPLIYDQWVEVVIDINLGTDSFTMTYGGLPLVTALGRWSWNANSFYGLPAGTATIQCVDLYSQMVGFRWDDVSLFPACYANCDNSTIQPCLNVQDFSCFLNKFAAQDASANCDCSTIVPVLNVQDFSCFLNAFAAGCSNC